MFAGFLLVISTSVCLAAAPTPEEIIGAFFGPAGIRDKAAYYTGEMKEHYSDKPTLGEGLKPSVTFSARRLPLSQPEAPVYAVDLRFEGEIANWYAFFGQDGGNLKLKAVRALGLTGLSYTLMESLEKLPMRTAEQEWTYRNLRLLFQADSELVAHFQRQLGELDALRLAIESKDAEAIRAKMQSLLFKGWERDQYGHLTIWIGGMLNNVVGVMYVRDGKPPSPSENEYIYIEHINGPWYLFKSS